jgi:uncharacterized protein (DUF2236 family)
MKTNPQFPLLTRYMGDWRSFMVGPAAGLLQLMHPAIGAAVAQQSEFFKDPNARVFRSVPQIWAMILDGGRSAERGLQLRDVHKHIQGNDESGRSFHALAPETFWWAHATFTWQVFRSIELFHRGGLEAVDCDALYAETVAWYRLYKLNEQPVPASYAAFQVKFADTCETTLKRTQAVTRALKPGRPGPRKFPRTRKEAMKLFWKEFTGLTLTGALPDRVRERFAIPWQPADQQRFEALRISLVQSGRIVPPTLNRASVELYLRVVGHRTRHTRYHPPERAGV